MNTTQFSVAALGFNDRDYALISSLCEISEHRAKRAASARVPSFRVIDPTGPQFAHVLLVNADDAAALESLQRILAKRPAAPVITVSKAPRDPVYAQELTVVRQRLGGSLIKLLDQIITTLGLGDHGTSRDDTRTKRCLIVDDSRLMRVQMELLLKKFKLDLSFAENAEIGLALLNEQSFDIVFLDIMLPEMDGYAARKLIKSNPNTRETAVVGNTVGPGDMGEGRIAAAGE